MLIDEMCPKTLTGIKRLATRIKRAEKIPHKAALNHAARAASFVNYEHARKQLAAHPNRCDQAFRLFLTAYWTDRETFEQGRETLEIELSQPLLEICSKPEMKLVRGLCNMRLAAPDQLVKDGLCHSRDYARDQICQSVRGMRLMEATGLKPCDYDRVLDSCQNLDCELPSKDHVSEWYDPRTGQFVLLDEPYSLPVISAERVEWARRNEWNLAPSSWPGIYFPYRCALFVASPKSNGFDFGDLMHKINALAEPVTAEDWQGRTVGGHDTFISPMATTPQDKRRAKAKGTVIPRESKKTIPYHRDLLGADRKPNGQMTLDEHRRTGRMIRAVLQSSYKPGAVNQRMDKLMRVLVDWLYADVPTRELQELYDPIDLYYGEMPEDDAYFVQANSSKGVIDVLRELRALLKESYPDCAPLRSQIGKLQTSLKITRSANPQLD